MAARKPHPNELPEDICLPEMQDGPVGEELGNLLDERGDAAGGRGTQENRRGGVRMFGVRLEGEVQGSASYVRYARCGGGDE